MSKISLLIFSYDRACQLAVLVDSLERFAPEQFDVHIIFKYSNDDFYEGYQKFFREHPWVGFTDEVAVGSDFRHCTLGIMQRDQRCGYEYLAMMTDDCICFREPFLDDLLWVMENNKDSVGVASLRLGLTNTVETYFTNSPSMPVTYTELTENVIGWRHWDYPPNSCWGYAHSVDGHIFRTEEILPLVQSISFNNPNDLEAGLSNITHKTKPYMISAREQSICACPVNSVSAYNNRSGDFHPMSTEFLNQNFLEGKRLDIERAARYALEHVNCTHYEIKFNFVEG